MKVFISSVTAFLKEERNELPAFLKVADHEPLRFEDFTAQDRSSREACLAGVDAADVYLLLLGPKYGEPLPDSDRAPTAEEFTRARQRGIPILVFNKDVVEPDEPAQAEFKNEVRGDPGAAASWPTTSGSSQAPCSPNSPSGPDSASSPAQARAATHSRPAVTPRVLDRRRRRLTPRHCSAVRLRPSPDPVASSARP